MKIKDKKAYVSSLKSQISAAATAAQREAAAQASAQAAALGPYAWLAFVGAGLGTLATMISTIQGFSNGGIIGGATTSGDMQLARVNAGEMILNNSQQARLFDLLDGGAAMIGNTQGKVDFRISGQALVGTLRNYNTKMSKVK